MIPELNFNLRKKYELYWYEKQTSLDFILKQRHGWCQ